MKKCVVIFVSFFLVLTISSCKPKTNVENDKSTEIVAVTQTDEFEEVPFIIATDLYNQFKQRSAERTAKGRVKAEADWQKLEDEEGEFTGFDTIAKDDDSSDSSEEEIDLDDPEIAEKRKAVQDERPNCFSVSGS